MRQRGSTSLALPVGLIASVMLLAAGCANIPRESVELSQVMGKQIQSLESADEATIRIFFKDKRAEARRFLKDEWIPQFANHYLSAPRVSKMLELTCGQQKHADCLRAILIISKHAEIQIQLQYRKILDPLDETENALLTAVQTDYSDVERENDALTALLISATKVQAERQAMLSKLGVSEKQIDGALVAVSGQVATVTSNAKSLDSNLENFTQKMRALRESLRGTPTGGT